MRETGRMFAFPRHWEPCTAGAMMRVGTLRDRNGVTRMKFPRVLLALVLAFGGAFAAVGPVAHAAAADLVCSGTETDTYSPGLRLTPQTETITVDAIYTSCTSTSDHTIASGQNHRSPTIPAYSCLSLLQSASGTLTFQWNNGHTSTFSYNRTATNSAGVYVVTQTGTITEGEFAGDTAVQTITGPVVNPLQCLAPPGITSQTGVDVLTITPA